ncbi:MAG: hypothetical protein ACFE68_02755 [Candidatus Hodarchaeota archaeon]
MFFDETKIFEAIEKISKSVVNINTLKMTPQRHGYAYHVVPTTGIGSGLILNLKATK